VSIGMLLIRADASTAIGAGHVMRCLALAQAWQDAGGRAVFAMAESIPEVQSRVRAEGFELACISGPVGTRLDSEQTANLAAKYSCGWIVLDGYRFGAEYQAILKQTGRSILLLDDFGQVGHYAADIILDQNPFVPESVYKGIDARCALLLGSKYTMLRREFTSWSGWRRAIPHVGQRILISMGGTDPDNLTARALQNVADSGINDLEVTVVAAKGHYDALAMEASFRLLRDVTSMSDLMSRSDVAMIAAGGTLWESLFMGCAVLTYVRNSAQKTIIENLQRAGAVVSLGLKHRANGAQLLHDIVYSQECRERLSSKGRELIDGLGAKRVVSVLQGDSR